MIEFTPAWLRRTGGLDDFLAAARRFPTVLEVTPAGLTPAGDLEERARIRERTHAPNGEDAAIDLIWLPWEQRSAEVAESPDAIGSRV